MNNITKTKNKTTINIEEKKTTIKNKSSAKEISSEGIGLIELLLVFSCGIALIAGSLLLLSNLKEESGIHQNKRNFSLLINELIQINSASVFYKVNGNDYFIDNPTYETITSKYIELGYIIPSFYNKSLILNNNLIIKYKSSKNNMFAIIKGDFITKKSCEKMLNNTTHNIDSYNVEKLNELIDEKNMICVTNFNKENILINKFY